MGRVGDTHFMFLHSDMAKKDTNILCEYLESDIHLMEEEEDDYDYDGGDNNDNDNVL